MMAQNLFGLIMNTNGSLLDLKFAVQYNYCTMKIKKIKTRNWVAKNNRCRPVRHRDRTAYQRRAKHVKQEQV